METLSDFTYTMESCNACGQCRFILGPKMKGWEFAEICPIYSKYQFDAFSGQGLINIAEEILKEELSYEEGLIEHIYSCLTCGACDVNCKSVRDMEVLDTILALRAKCVENGWGPMQAHKKQGKNINDCHNIFGYPHDRRFNWSADDLEISEKADAVYFVGCSTSYSYPQIAKNTVKILNAAGIKFSVMNSQEYCCGAPLWRTGQLKEAQSLAARNIEAINNASIKTIITSCAECYGTFRGLYPRIKELNFEVRHISQIIQEMLQEGRLKLNKTINLKLTYHDPCFLGRLSELYVPWSGQIKAFGYHDPPKQWRRGTGGEYDAPRQVLKTVPGIQIFEMTRNAENGFCCGGGGGVPAAFPDFALWTASERLREAKATGAEAIVSCCPWCQSNFLNAIDLKKNDMHYYDLTELVVMGL